MTQRLKAFAVAWCAAVAGCADITQSNSTIPVPTTRGNQQATVMADDGEVPWFSDESEVPPEYSAEVLSVRATVAWDGYLAKGYGSSEWKGNRGVLTLSMNILNGTSSVASLLREYPQGYLIPARYVIGQPLEYAVSTNCDHIANFSATQEARTKLGIGEHFITLGPSTGEASAYALQPACQKEEDPDAPPPEEESSGPSGGSGSGSGGSGEPTVWCYTTTYSVQRWNGTDWQHEFYETETTCYSF
jgi:hypothetical protein